MCKTTTVFFHAVLWKKQMPDACFNLFLVLLLNPDTLAVLRAYNYSERNRPDLIFTMHNKECIK